MLGESRTGPQTLADGPAVAVRAGKDGSAVISAAHARYTEACYRGNVFTIFSGSITSSEEEAAGVLFTKGGEGSKAKLICGIFNPTNSGRNAVILSSIISVLAATKQSGPFVYSYQQCPALKSSASGTIRNTNISAAPSSVMVAANNVKIERQDASNAAYVTLAHLGGNATGSALAATTATPETRDNPEGKIVVPPGTVFGISTWNQGEAATLLASLTWEETPV